MKLILRDPKIQHLARRCEALARDAGIQRSAAAFIHESIFSMKSEDRLYDGRTPCVGAVELELLRKRDALLAAVCKARGVDLRGRHLDRIARQYGDIPNP